jgi:hypothetical protein
MPLRRIGENIVEGKNDTSFNIQNVHNTFHFPIRGYFRIWFIT